jgi:hypothetical protein
VTLATGTTLLSLSFFHCHCHWQLEWAPLKLPLQPVPSTATAASAHRDYCYTGAALGSGSITPGPGRGTRGREGATAQAAFFSVHCGSATGSLGAVMCTATTRRCECASTETQAVVAAAVGRPKYWRPAIRN